MDQTSSTARLHTKDLVYGCHFSFVLINCLSFGVLFGFQGMGVTIMVLALLFFIMIWNKNGFLSSWCPPDLYMFVRHGREILFILEWKYGRVWRSSIDLCFIASTSFENGRLLGSHGECLM